MTAGRTRMRRRSGESMREVSKMEQGTFPRPLPAIVRVTAEVP
jgi:hypothetical protein